MQMRLLWGLQDLPAPMQIGKNAVIVNRFAMTAFFWLRMEKEGYFLVSSSRVFFRFWRICS